MTKSHSTSLSRINIINPYKSTIFKQPLVELRCLQRPLEVAGWHLPVASRGSRNFPRARVPCSCLWCNRNLVDPRWGGRKFQGTRPGGWTMMDRWLVDVVINVVINVVICCENMAVIHVAIVAILWEIPVIHEMRWFQDDLRMNWLGFGWIWVNCGLPWLSPYQSMWYGLFEQNIDGS